MTYAPKQANLPGSRAGRRGVVRDRSWTVLAIATAMLFGSRPATAQIADAWLRYTPVDAYAGGKSSRLEAMGGIEVAVPDDQGLFDPYHYGGNPAALLVARDTSVVRIPTGYSDFEDGYWGFNQSAVGRGAGLHAEFRPRPKWGIGLDFDYGSTDASRNDQCPAPDDCRFIRDFDLPIAPEMEPVTTDRVFGAGVQTPSIGVSYARTFFNKVTLGVRLGHRYEEEHRRIINPYPLNTTSTATEFAGGAYYPLPILDRSASLSAWYHYVANKVTGTSQTPFNDDKYDWDRPEVAFGGALYVKKGDWLEGIAYGEHRSFDGEEIARINWAPQFFMNPFPPLVNPNNVFKKDWSAFLSGFRHNEGSTRWLVGLAGKPIHLGAQYAYYRQYEWITPNEVVLPTVDELNVKRQGYRFAGGISLGREGQGIVALEGRIAREFRDDFTGELPGISMITYSYHFGGEYPLRHDLPVRAGVEALRHDPNREDIYSPVKGIGITAGAGYYWKPLQSRLDFSYAHYHFHYSPGDPSEEIGGGNQVTLALQRLF